MKRALAALAVVASCSTNPPQPQPPPAPSNQMRITTTLVCFEVWHRDPPPFDDGSAYNVNVWRWSTVDSGHVQIQDQSDPTVVATKDVPLGGGTFTQRFALPHVGVMLWQHDGGWSPVALFPGNVLAGHACSSGEV